MNGGKAYKVKGWSRLDIPVGELAKAKGVKNGFTVVLKCKSNNISSGVTVWSKVK